MGKLIGFSTFHSALKNSNFFVASGMTQAGFYQELFDDIYRCNEYSISNWCNGKCFVVRAILVATEKKYLDHYAEKFKKYINQGHIFDEEMLNNFKADIMYSRNEVQKDGVSEEILANALVEALFNDYVRSSIEISKSINDQFCAIDSKCKENDVAFFTPHMLYAIFLGDDNTLLRALNSLYTGYGDEIKQITENYVRQKKHSNKYNDCGLSGYDFITFAKKIAYKNDRKEADDIDLIQGMYLTKSKTLSDIVTQIRLLRGDVFTFETLVSAMQHIKNEQGKTTNIIHLPKNK